MSDSENTGKYHVENHQPILGQVIGDHNTVHQHFHAPADSRAPSCDVIILTALPVEYQAVLRYLQEPQEVVHPLGTIYQRGTFTGKYRTWHVAVAEIGMGGLTAALEAEKAINFFHAQVALFVGIAGGLKDVRQGDVVAASKIYVYESGKAKRTFEPRPELGHPSHALEQRARAEAHNDEWLSRLDGPCPDPVPNVFIGALAAGEKILASKQSNLYRLLKNTYGDALAVEMEGHGFLHAVRVNHTVHGLVIRGISDLIDNKPVADASGSQIVAARHAAAFAFQVLAKLTFPTLDSMRPHAEHTHLGQTEYNPRLPYTAINAKQMYVPSLFAFQYKEQQLQTWPPFDVGMVWGINRGSFVAVLLADESLNLCAHLSTVELAFFDALSEEERRKFSARRWILLDLEQHLTDLQSLSDVQAAANSLEERLPSNGIPGFVIKIGRTTLHTSANCCRTLLARFSGTQLALIFVINANQSKSMYTHLESLAQQLQNIPEVGNMVEIMALDPFTSNPDAAADAASSAPTGTHFAQWVKLITDTKDYRHQKHDPKIRQDFALVLSTYEKINSQRSQLEKMELCSAEDVAADIEMLPSSLLARENQELFDRQFLHMVRLYLPGYMFALVQAYAHSYREIARLTALSIAIDSETLLDAWIRGTFNGEKQAAQKGEESLLELIDNDAFSWEASEALVVALMRNYGNMPNTSRKSAQVCLKRCLAKLGRAENLEKIWQLFCESVEGTTDQVAQLATSFFQEKGFSEERIRLALRANLYLHSRLPLKALQPFLDLDHPDVWWLLMALPPTQERMSQLLALLPGVDQRLVAGICTPEEWQQHAHDLVLQENLLACRYGRLLCFRFR